MDDLECSVCLQVFFKPHIITRCGHTYCLGCIQSVSKCPLCNKNFSKDDLCRNFTVDSMVQTHAKERWEKRKAEEEKKTEPPTLDAFGAYTRFMRDQGFGNAYIVDSWGALKQDPNQLAYWSKNAQEEQARASWNKYVREEEKGHVVDLTGDNPNSPGVPPYMMFAQSMRQAGSSYGEILEGWTEIKLDRERYDYWCKKAQEENARLRVGTAGDEPRLISPFSMFVLDARKKIPNMLFKDILKAWSIIRRDPEQRGRWLQAAITERVRRIQQH